ncbi:hypothetical protein [Streptosporangium sp. NPDC051022]|uniref:hypothetical protein n=1 Tax=Streptosporangium sp. NPDC051022 TaxID=3155752 RepID=UPI00343198C5
MGSASISILRRCIEQRNRSAQGTPGLGGPSMRAFTPGLKAGALARNSADVVFASDPERAQRMTGQTDVPPEIPLFIRGGADDEAEADIDPVVLPVQTEMSTGQLIVEERKRLHEWLGGARRSLENLEELGNRVSFPPLLGSPEEWLDLQHRAFEVLEFIQRNRTGGPEDDEEE